MPRPTIDQLRERVRGRVITPDDPDYGAARQVYNAMIDRRPRVVVGCVDAADVMAGVDFARDNGLELSVRGGSHSVPGFGTNDDGVVLDLAGMRGVRIDPLTHTARAEGGCTWGEVNHAGYPFGLATTGGIVSTTGIGGLTLGGGIGYLSRHLGLTVDNLLSVDVVTAEGRQLVASDKSNEDLYWAAKGAGPGFFAVVTRFYLKLYDLPGAIGFASQIFPLDMLEDVYGWAHEIGLDVEKFKTDLDSGKYKKVIDKDLADGEGAGVYGTPAFFINGKLYNGTLNLATLKPILDAELKPAAKPAAVRSRGSAEAAAA